LISVQGKERHDKPGRAIPTLTAIGVYHRFLNGMECSLGILQIFNGYQLLAVNHREEYQTRVDSPVTQISTGFDFAQHHRASAAISFRTSLFDTFVSWVISKELENGCCRRKLRRTEIYRFHTSIKNKRYRLRH
jgi:hypothetical protein